MQYSFNPHPLVRGGHLQTLVGKFASPEKPYPADKVIHVPVSGGDEMVIEVNHPPGHEAQKLLILFHGLGGCSESDYMLRIGRKATRKGISVARVNHRGCGRHSAECRGIYHSGSVDDMLAALKSLEDHFPALEKYAVAFSLSGTILLNCLAVYPDETTQILKKAIPVSSPVDLEVSSVALDSWKNVKYNLFYTYFLKQQAKLRNDKYGKSNYPDVKKVKSLREFDQVYTAAVGGFKDRLDYYTQWSPKRHAEKIKVDTLLLLAKDDPIVPKSSIEAFKPSSSVEMVVTDSGGHLGYISKEKLEDNDYRWMDSFVLSAL